MTRSRSALKASRACPIQLYFMFLFLPIVLTQTNFLCLRFPKFSRVLRVHQIIGGTPPSLAAKYQLVIMIVAAGAATITTLLASSLALYALIDSQHRIRSEKLVPRATVSRIDAIRASARLLVTKFGYRREQSIELRSPFPAHVSEPIPSPSNPAIQSE